MRRRVFVISLVIILILFASVFLFFGMAIIPSGHWCMEATEDEELIASIEYDYQKDKDIWLKVSNLTNDTIYVGQYAYLYEYQDGGWQFVKTSLNKTTTLALTTIGHMEQKYISIANSTGKMNRFRQYMLEVQIVSKSTDYHGKRYCFVLSDDEKVIRSVEFE